MKILFWAPLFWPDIGGIEVLAMKSLPALRARGFEFVVVTCHGLRDLPDRMDYEGIPVHRYCFLDILAKKDLSQIGKIRRQISELKQLYKPDLVHMNFGVAPIMYFHLKTAHIHPVPTLLTLHGSVSGYDGGSHTLLGDTLRKADWVAAVSEAVLSDAAVLMPEIYKQSSVIHNGLDMPDLLPGPFSLDPPRLLCVGRLYKEKGFDLAIDAFALCLKHFPRARLIIAGDGPQRQSLERQAFQLGIAEYVQFKGWVLPEDVPKLMDQASVVVIPSRIRESFGLVAVEAAQMARPVVASGIGGLEETVKHGETGLLVKEQDGSAFADAILRLLNNPEAARRMGEAGYSQARKKFGLDRYVDAYASLYRGLIAENKKVPVETR